MIAGFLHDLIWSDPNFHINAFDYSNISSSTPTIV